MELIFISVLIIQLLIGFFGRNETGEKKFLGKSAQFLYWKLMRRFICKTSMYIRVDEYMSNLNPGKDRNVLTGKYYVEKIRLSYALILIGNILAINVSLASLNNNLLQDNIVIPKNSWRQGSYALDLKVATKNQEYTERNITVVIEPVSLTEQEAALLANEAFLKLRTVILGNNLCFSQITDNLNLVTKLDSYPFTINWEIDKPSLIRKNGVIHNEGITTELGEVVKITAHLLYRDEWVEYHFSEEMYVNLLPHLVALSDGWEEAIKSAVSANKYEMIYADSLILPEEINGIAVSWQEVKSKDSVLLWVITITAAFIAFAIQDKELRGKVKTRNEQIDRDYPELVRKLALYIGAGMTLRGAWKRVAHDYEKTGGKVRNLYEEMLCSVRELENGIPEREVYERFGKRVGIAKYRKLTGLLSNHLQKGNKNLIQVLREESEMALEDRKKRARVVGEEMSTKLLLPMMMMLLVVMIIVMVPALKLF